MTFGCIAINAPDHQVFAIHPLLHGHRALVNDLIGGVQKPAADKLVGHKMGQQYSPIQPL